MRRPQRLAARGGYYSNTVWKEFLKQYYLKVVCKAPWSDYVFIKGWREEEEEVRRIGDGREGKGKEGEKGQRE